jgi:glycosyltransferase involved in cell wall biosynthesis
MTCSIVIATYNRAADLRDTLASLAKIQTARAWEVVVVDNNSPDDTRSVVETAARTFPVTLRYAFERAQGRSPALNTGITLAAGDVILTTDDDVRVEPDWLDRAVDALDRLHCDYVGGRVLPIWGAPRPRWLPETNCRQWAVIALLDYGAEPMAFGARVPLGVNMAFRRSAFDRAGLFDPHTGRKAGTLLGQEVREWCIRARAAGVVGWYAPEMFVRHVIPGSRLNKRYFRRWFYWRGISRALLYRKAGLDMEAPEDTRLDFRTVPHVLGVPRYLFRKALHTMGGVLTAWVRRDRVASFEQELWLCFFAGILVQRMRDRRAPVSHRAARAALGSLTARVRTTGR